MLPILLIHGYSSEGKDTPAKKIYGHLPKLLRKEFDNDDIKELDLSRWISLSDGVSLDDVSFAMDRALKKDFPHLLESGFHVVIHSTGALVVRNWIKKYSPKPSPINNIVHLAGANFGSGLAHIGKGQLARWRRFIFTGSDSGTRVLKELELGCWKTLELHRYFLQSGNDMHADYQVQEFCLNGSQTFAGTLKTVINLIPIRYVKEDSSDNTVRTSACNLNYNYIEVFPSARCKKLSASSLKNLMKKRETNSDVTDRYYDYSLNNLSSQRKRVPFGLLYETAHFGSDIGIVDGKKNRRHVLPHIKAALETPYSEKKYEAIVKRYQKLTDKTLERASKLKPNIFGWNKQSQYECHMQVIIRIKDQYGHSVDNTDITFNSDESTDDPRLESMIEDKHRNTLHKGTITFYFRTVRYKNKQWQDKLKNIAPLNVEITGYEPDSDHIAYLPMSIKLSSSELKVILRSFCTTVIDVTMMRLPKDGVFAIEKA